MPRLAIPKPVKRHRKPPTERDRVLFVLKVAGLVVVTAVVAGFLLVSGGGGGQEEVAATNPAVPTITDRDDPGDGGGTGDAVPTAVPTPTESVAAPAVGTQTAVIAPRAKPKAAPRPAPSTRPGPESRFARAGQPCPRPGAYAFTKKFEPLVCGPNGRWQPLF